MLASFPKKVSSYLFFMITGMYMYSHIFVFVLRKKPSPSPIPLIKCTFMSRFYVSQWVETLFEGEFSFLKTCYFTKYFFDHTMGFLIFIDYLMKTRIIPQHYGRNIKILFNNHEAFFFILNKVLY